MTKTQFNNLMTRYNKVIPTEGEKEATDVTNAKEAVLP